MDLSWSLLKLEKHRNQGRLSFIASLCPGAFAEGFKKFKYGMDRLVYVHIRMGELLMLVVVIVVVVVVVVAVAAVVVGVAVAVAVVVVVVDVVVV